MKKFIRFVGVIVCAACLCASLASCSHLKKLTYDSSGILTGSSVGTGYKYAPLGYEPTSVGDEYALIDNEMQEILYRIGDLDPAEWLTTEYAGGATMVYCSADTELPDLEELKSETAYFCIKGDTPDLLAEIGKGDGEGELIEKLCGMLCDPDTEDEMWPRTDINESYLLRFYSSDWPAIYYSVTYADCASGNYIYDKIGGKCVKIGDELEKYYESTNTSDNVG